MRSGAGGRTGHETPRGGRLGGEGIDEAIGEDAVCCWSAVAPGEDAEDSFGGEAVGEHERTLGLLITVRDCSSSATAWVSAASTIRDNAAPLLPNF
ncbi:hypothetical protein RHA1_ro02766 [Rhodococcus jostii RHA1]|uniref:Uncharacterized protein n=1 Tax=Rhodococcus jostii (strain RHA1) TaxID=101510 RepID=Q0SD15_RHOJR|nr:hypothetical protein RHA1_ro02766 [Rhodococcus jostii RHA1]